METVKRKSLFLFYILLFCAFVFILKRDICFVGAVGGISFCLYTVIPAVFPYTVVCKMLIKSGCIGKTGIITSGLLCGFPAGAHMCCEMYEKGHMDKRTSEVLCAVTSGMTPTFVIGFVGVHCMKNAQKGVVVYLICAFSAILYALVSKVSFTQKTADIPSKPFYSIFTESVYESILSVMSLCGYVIFFSVVCEFLKLLSPFLPPYLLYIIFLFSEITTGVFNAAALGTVLSQRMFFAVLSSAVSFSGICAHMQLITLIKQSGLSPARFIMGKWWQSVTSFFISYIVYGIIFG